MIGVHKFTVSRELKCKREQRGYRPQQAHSLAMERMIGGANCPIAQFSIEERPAGVNARKRLNDWEAETFLDKHHKPIMMTECKSRFTLLGKMP